MALLRDARKQKYTVFLLENVSSGYVELFVTCESMKFSDLIGVFLLAGNF